MSQIVQIHLGSAGVQIGDQSWDLSCEQFKVGLDGQAKDIDDDRQIVFNEVKENSFRPRAVFADMEQTPISEVMKGPRKGIYSKNIFEYGKESGCTYANGYFYKGREILDKIVDKIRQQAEKCNHLDGIIYHTCLSGGTGSGLGDDLLSKLEVDYPKIPKIPVLVVPSPNYSQLILEPYNAILAISTIFQYQNLCICVDNESLYRNCETQDIELPNYQNINQLIAMITNNLIVGNCGNMSYSLQKLVTNLMIQPKIQFVYPSLSFYNVEKSITTQLKENTMLSYHKQDGIVISRAIFYRGDFSLNCIQNQQNVNFQSQQVIFIRRSSQPRWSSGWDERKQNDSIIAQDEIRSIHAVEQSQHHRIVRKYQLEI